MENARTFNSPIAILVLVLAISTLIFLTLAGVIRFFFGVLLAALAVATVGFLVTLAVDWLISRFTQNPLVHPRKVFFRWLSGIGWLLIISIAGVFFAPPPDVQLRTLFASNPFLLQLALYADLALPGFVLASAGRIGLRRLSEHRLVSEDRA